MAIADTIQSMYENVGEVYDTITNVEVNNGTNLLDYSTCKIGDLNTGTGAEETSTVRIISDFVEVTPNENYICTLIGGDYTTYYYKSDKTFISGGSSWIGSGNSFTTPNNTGYLRLKFKNTNNTTISLNDLSNVMLNKGSTALPYQPYTDNPTNKNIQNIPSTMRSSYLEIMNNGIDKIWNNWEKVTGEGETLTLNSTEEAPMKINLKGNTSQETTTGKNKYNATRSSATTNAVTYSGDTSKIYINGTPSNTGRIFFNKTYLEAGTYTFSATLSKGSFTNGGNNLTYLYLYKGTETTASWDFNTRILLTATIGNVVSATFTISEGSYYYLSWYLDTNYTWTNAEIKYQVESGSSFTSFEPYTNGPSPNPDYPQDIHVVSGDNSIDVCGKNLFDYNKITKSAYYTNNYDGTFTRNSNGSSITINVNDASVPYDKFSLKAGTYSVSFDIKTTATATLTNFFMCTIQNGTGSNLVKNIGVQIPANTTTHIKAENYVVVNNAEKVGFAGYLNASTGVVISNIQVEKNNQATTYEAYKGASYPISLGAENLLQNNLTSGTNNGITYVVNEDKSVTLNGTATAITWLILNSSVTLEAGTYTMTSGYSGNDVRVYSTGLGVYTLDGQRTVTKTSSVSGDVSINIPSGTICNNLTIKPMIEKSSKANSYTPYGTTPIELCKIGDYQDSIKKSTGKNLFDKSAIEEGKRLGSDGLSFTDTSFDLSDYIKVDSNTQYTYSRGSNGSGSSAIAYYDSSKTFISRTMPIMDSNARKVVLTTPNNATYVRIADLKTTLDSMQFEKNSSATPYEPYGKVWYLNKQIGKLVLDGTQNITLASSGTRRFNATYTTLGISNVKEGTSAENTTLNYRMNDHFIYSAGQNTWGRYYLYNNWLVMLDSGSTIASASDLSTWLSNNNTTVYYVLATPTYTEITDSTLLEQLEAFYNAKSKNSQTNITQENNDLPFILDATALKQLN